MLQKCKPAADYYEKRMIYRNWFNQTIKNESWFHLSGYVNSQNMRMWSTENAHYFEARPLHLQLPFLEDDCLDLFSSRIRLEL